MKLVCILALIFGVYHFLVQEGDKVLAEKKEELIQDKAHVYQSAPRRNVSKRRIIPNIAQKVLEPEPQRAPAIEPSQEYQTVELFLQNELELSEREFEIYLSLKEDREEDVRDFFDEPEFNEGDVFELTENQEIELQEINQYYHDELRNTLGEDRYSKYKDFLISFRNERFEEEATSPYAISF